MTGQVGSLPARCGAESGGGALRPGTAQLVATIGLGFVQCLVCHAQHLVHLLALPATDAGGKGDRAAIDIAQRMLANLFGQAGQRPARLILDAILEEDGEFLAINGIQTQSGQCLDLLAQASELAEIGVILLMFGVGLNFSLKDMISVQAVAIPGALGHSSVWPEQTARNALEPFFGSSPSV